MTRSEYPGEPERVRRLNDKPVAPEGRFVLYWMQQAQRAEWSHALEYAVSLANRHDVPTLALFGLTAHYPQANARHYRFLLEGLEEVAACLRRRGIGFVCRFGAPDEVVVRASREAVAVITDAGYMPIKKRWRERVAREVGVSVVQVETDVIVPVALASDHEEFAARTLRPKLQKLLPRFLRPVDPVRVHRPWRSPVGFSNDWKNVDETFQSLENLDRSVAPVDSLHGGLREARRRLRVFVEQHLAKYPERRSEPAADCRSGLSAYLHFGQISPLEIALAVQQAGAPRAAQEAFLEELVIRRELAMNLAHYRGDCEHYACIPKWARDTLAKHDRPWAESPVFGAVRYMSAEGLVRKFDMESYVRKFE